jgi:hypothetical protein
MNGANARGLETLIIAEDFRQRRPNESKFLVAHTTRVLLPFHWIHPVQQRNERQTEVQLPMADQPDHLVMIEHAAACEQRGHAHIHGVGEHVRTDKRSAHQGAHLQGVDGHVRTDKEHRAADTNDWDAAHVCDNETQSGAGERVLSTSAFARIRRGEHERCECGRSCQRSQIEH